jgi:hypothetical protein
MPRSNATSVAEYLDELPEDRRATIAAVRSVIKKYLPSGYEERVNYGMISYEIPLSRYSTTYNRQPLSYVALAAQKNYNAIYMMRVYGDTMQENKLRNAFKKAGKKLDMGKSCIRFKAADDLPLETIGELVASTSADAWIAIFEASRKR